MPTNAVDAFSVPLNPPVFDPQIPDACGVSSVSSFNLFITKILFNPLSSSLHRHRDSTF